MAAQHDHLLSVIRRMEDSLENTLRQLKKEQARRKDAEEKLKRAMRGRFDDENTAQAVGQDNHIVEEVEEVEEAFRKKDAQIVAMQTIIMEKERKIWDFQESNLRKARQVSVIQAALNRKERECQALEEEKDVELKIQNDAMQKLQVLKVLLAEKEEENVELRARLHKRSRDEEAFQVVEEMEPLLEDASKNGVEGDLADNQGEELLQTTAQGDFGQQDIAEGSFLTQVTLPVASGFPESATVSDDNGNMICLSSDTVDVEIFPNILSYREQAAADHLEVKTDETNKCRQCGLEFRTRYWLMKHLKQLGHKSSTDCDVCKKKFSNKYTLKAHRDRAHSSELPFACIKCGRRFKDRERCSKHQANDALHQRLERKNLRGRTELEKEPRPAAARSPSSCQVKSSRKRKVPHKER